MFRQVLLIAFAISIAACSSAPPSIDYEFATFEPIEVEPTYPSELPFLRPLQCFPSDDDCQIAGYKTPQEIDTLERYKILSSGNAEIATANANALETMVAREGAILAAAGSQESITRLREEQLAWERSERTKEKWYYRGLLVIAIAVGAYSSGN